MATTYLDEIIQHHRERAARDDRAWRPRLEAMADAASVRSTFATSLRSTSRSYVAVIAEVKRRSPSKGWLNEHLGVENLTLDYEAGGASAISVLTDETYFSGSLADLEVARRTVSLPILRKDFTVCENDVLDAAGAGANAVLVIVAALDDEELTSFLEVAERCGLDVLVEVHDESEVTRALDAGATIIGVNQRDLRTFDVDTERAAKLVGRLPRECLSVCESGLSSVEDVRAAANVGFDAVLVGEAFVCSLEPRASVAAYAAVARNT